VSNVQEVSAATTVHTIPEQMLLLVRCNSRQKCATPRRCSSKAYEQLRSCQKAVKSTVQLVDTVMSASRQGCLYNTAVLCSLATELP